MSYKIGHKKQLIKFKFYLLGMMGISNSLFGIKLTINVDVKEICLVQKRKINVFFLNYYVILDHFKYVKNMSFILS